VRTYPSSVSDSVNAWLIRELLGSGSSSDGVTVAEPSVRNVVAVEVIDPSVDTAPYVEAASLDSSTNVASSDTEPAEVSRVWVTDASNVRSSTDSGCAIENAPEALTDSGSRTNVALPAKSFPGGSSIVSLRNTWNSPSERSAPKCPLIVESSDSFR